VASKRKTAAAGNCRLFLLSLHHLDQHSAFVYTSGGGDNLASHPIKIAWLTI
jgi:hypothetical protein